MRAVQPAVPPVTLATLSNPAWARNPAAQPLRTATLEEDLLLLRSLGPAEMGRRFRHPEHGRSMGLDEMLALYAWHGQHHVAHITKLRSRMGWE